MDRSLRSLPLFLCASLLLGLPARGQTSPKVVPQRATATQPGDCDLGGASADLDVGGVRARLYNTGGLFWRGGDPVYELPKDSGITAIFAAGIWLGGTVDGQLRSTGAGYFDWQWGPGPLDATGTAPADCGAAFDRIYVVTRRPDGSLAGDVATWPAHLGAPFNDADGDGVYEPEAGETPTVYGHQTTFWVMNDRAVARSESSSPGLPLGVTARVTAFAFNSADPALGFGTFYRYQFENPNAYTIENARFGLWSDGDVGAFTDDVVGSDPDRGLSFYYNGDTSDGSELFPGYGYAPPALGIDILSGAEGALYYENLAESPFGDPVSGAERYAYLNLRYLDGTPMTEGGLGYNPDAPAAPPASWVWPGRVETFDFWSEFAPGEGLTPRAPADRRLLSVAEPFELGPGETHTVDVALLWGRGVSFLDSVTKLRDHSDRVQAAYDTGSLLGDAGPQSGLPDSSPLPPPLPTLATPTPTFPADDADLADVTLPRTNPECAPEDPDRDCTEVQLAWAPVPRALYYEVQISDLPDFSDEPLTMRLETTALSQAFTDNNLEMIYWRVRAGNATELSAFSAPQSYQTRFNYVPKIRDAGAGIVETAYAGTPTCDGAGPVAGCADYDGASVWLTPNPSADYYVTSWLQGTIDRLEWRIDLAAPFDYEVRFSDACASEGCYGINYLLEGEGEVVRVPFELWQVGVGTFDDASDDVRLIPLLLRAVNTPSIEAWRFAVDSNPGNGDDIESAANFEALTSDAIYGMYPDRPGGYARFAEAAPAIGVGNVFEGFDTQTDLDPRTGEPCERQGFFVDFCHRNDELPADARVTDFISLISRLQFADQAGDGTPPPSGTTIRLLTTKTTPPVNAEPEVPDDPSVPETLTLEVFPNPARGLATIEYGQAGRTGATLDVFDTVGRLVAQLDEGVQEAGTYQTELDVGSLAAGVYFVVFRSVNARKVFPISVVR